MASPSPPAELAALLAELQLATPSQLARAARRAQRLCRGLPLLDQAWVEALVRSQRLTPYQGAEIQAGRGAQLLVGDWVILRPLAHVGLGNTFLARRRADRHVARLSLVCCPAPLRRRALEHLQREMATGPLVKEAARPLETGDWAEGVWSAWPAVKGRSLGALLQQRGRLPAAAALEIARQMADSLWQLERSGFVHGDLRAGQVLLTAAGEIRLLETGLRAAARPVESLADAGLDDLPTELLDGLSPERAGCGEPPTLTSDLFSCGSLWWQLACGRATVSAATSRQRLERIAIQGVPDVQLLAPETPPQLAEAIHRLTAFDPGERPRSFAQACELLGPSTPAGRRLVRRCLTAQHWSWNHGPVSERRPTTRRVTQLAATAAAALIGLTIYTQGAGDDVVREPAATVDSFVNVAAGPHPSPGPADNWAAPLAPAQPISETVAENSSPLPEPTAFRPENAEPLPRDALVAGETPSRLAKVDQEVKAATHVAVDPHLAPDVFLPVGRPLRVRALNLQPNQTVRGSTDRRPLVVVPAQGLAVRAENVRFVGIDFVAGIDRPDDAPLLHITSRQATFRDCTFQGVENTAETDIERAQPVWPTAISWQPPREAPFGGDERPRLALQNCGWRRVDRGVRCDAPGGELSIVNGLHLGPGPWLDLVRPWDQATTWSMTLERCTLRNAACLLRLPAILDAADAAGLAVRLNRCVLSPDATTGSVVALDEIDMEKVSALLGRWEATGCLLTPGCSSVTVVEPGDGETRAPRWPLTRFLTESLIIERAELDFAGAADDGPQASQLLNNAEIGADLEWAPDHWPTPNDPPYR